MAQDIDDREATDGEDDYNMSWVVASMLVDFHSIYALNFWVYTWINENDG